MLDCHVHIMEGAIDSAGLSAQMREAGCEGAIMISLAPRCFPNWAEDHTSEERLDNLFAWCEANPKFFPFYWIDPTEDDALAQVDLAVKRGVLGFKCICDHFYPNDPKAQPIFRAIAQAGKPLLFHSGTLWDGKDSSRYNRPAEFEALIDIPGLRFSMAHISWPWCDELIALYGKFQAARTVKPGEVPDLFIDTTPGTPHIYREEALRKVFTVGYDLNHNIMIGSDQCTGRYKPEAVKNLIARDTGILRGLGVEEDNIAAVMGGNLERFLGN
jgi:predicted TIM-barrel fold metal-dependent hydrolase